MPLTDVGLLHIASLVISEPGTPFDLGNAFLAVGDGNDAFSVEQTDLQGSNKFRKLCELATRNGSVYTYRTTLNTNEANFVWREWATTNADAGGVMLNRKAVDLGEKTEAAVFEFTVEVQWGQAE